MFDKHVLKPLFRPYVNIGGLLDIPTGLYELGKHGESILNGGLGPLTGITSRPNNFKTALAIYMMSMLRRNFEQSNALIYDTEGTLNPVARFQAISSNYPELKDVDWEYDTQYTFTDLSRYTGDLVFKLYRETVNDKVKNPNKYTYETPFIDREGENRKALYPTGFLIDSFSKFQIVEVQDSYAKHKVGDAKNNTTAMTSGKAKTQLFDQLPTVCAQTGSYIVLTAHTGDIINIEMYPTDKRNLSHMKKDTVVKGVGPGFYSLPHNVWSIETNKPLWTKDKTPLYPIDNKTAEEGDADLKVIEIQNLRGKNGVTGRIFSLVVSQKEGYLPHLSEFHYIKEHDFGISGNDVNYVIDLCPNIGLSRTKIRSRIMEHPELCRALEIQSELLQIIQFHSRDDEQVKCMPKELYEDLKEIGYDWDLILHKTRGWYVPKELDAGHPLKFLSTKDLLRMRKGLYAPYWMPDEERNEYLMKAKELWAKRLIEKTA